MKHFNLPYQTEPDLSKWQEIVDAIRHPRSEVNVAIVGKYTALLDSYKSLIEALIHGGIANKVKVNFQWIEAQKLETMDNLSGFFENTNAILVPGGFGERGSEGKIKAIQYAREHNIPFLGICFGMQMAVIECARNLANLTNASSSEFGPTDEPLIGILTEWIDADQVKHRYSGNNMGGTMRLGSYQAVLTPNSKVAEIYGDVKIQERHRHRYEVNIHYKDQLEKTGLRFSGLSPDGVLPEIVEYTDHPWFIAVQYHPELKSKPFSPHPLFSSFIKAATEQAIPK